MTRRRTVQEMNYARLEKLIGQPLEDLPSYFAMKLVSDQGFMDLHIEGIGTCPEEGVNVLSLAHYYEQNRDLCQDPEMTMRVFPPTDERRQGSLQAMTFQQANPPIYRNAFPAPRMVDPRLLEELNTFLATWLRSLKEQGHRPTDEEEAA